ncbi:hypothetical protein ACLOJK_038888 [Asimina triloba]
MGACRWLASEKKERGDWIGLLVCCRRQQLDGNEEADGGDRVDAGRCSLQKTSDEGLLPVAVQGVRQRDKLQSRRI